MTLFFTNLARIKQYLPALYFIGVAIWIGFENANPWIGLAVIPFILQLVLNNKYLNLILGFLMIAWSTYMALAMFIEIEKTIQFVLLASVFTIANLYMSRMLFLNQNFTIAALRENSLDEILFI